MTSLRGRIGVALFVFGMTTLIVVGAALWVALRELHRDAALGSLAELTVPYVAQARQRFPLEVLATRRPLRGILDTPGQRPAQLDEQATQQSFLQFVREAQDEIDAAGVSVLLLSERAGVVRDPTTREIGSLTVLPDVDVPDQRGVVTTGSTSMDGIGQILYAATPIGDARVDRDIPALVLFEADRSAELATADLLRALTIAAICLVVIGIPIAYGLGRSVARPLGRLAAASGAVARGEVPEPLPTSGPREVADASAAFNSMAAEVDATRQAQRQLLADVRHDLRTPLTVISGFSEALRDGTAKGPAADRAADAISAEAARLERMLDDLDHLTVRGTPGRPLHLEPLDGVTIARQTVARFRAKASAQGQRLSLSEAVAQAPFQGDRDAIDRLLGNIVVNALTHAPSPGGRAEIEVALVPAAPTTRAGGGRRESITNVVLAVRDDGPGIPAAALPHVFDRFYRADASRSGPGSGLGLAIVRDLAEALGGTAFAENPAGGGARVGVVLPTALAPDRDDSRTA